MIQATLEYKWKKLYALNIVLAVLKFATPFVLFAAHTADYRYFSQGTSMIRLESIFLAILASFTTIQIILQIICHWESCMIFAFFLWPLLDVITVFMAVYVYFHRQ